MKLKDRNILDQLDLIPGRVCMIRPRALATSGQAGGEPWATRHVGMAMQSWFDFKDGWWVSFREVLGFSAIESLGLFPRRPTLALFG